jgi:glycerate dehydrogenase
LISDFIWPRCSQAARERLMAILVDNLKAYIGGKPVNNVAK